MSRAMWKGYYISSNISKDLKPSKPIKIWQRDSSIPSFLIGKKVSIHNGKDFKDLLIEDKHLGYKFGEFAFTRHHGGHKALKKNQKKKKNK